MKQAISPRVPKWLCLKLTTRVKIISCYHGYYVIMEKTWYRNIILGSNL